VLLHTGYAINIIDEAEARETLKLLEEMTSQS
jgi:hydrogenase maturation factor